MASTTDSAVAAYTRRAGDETVLVVVNFASRALDRVEVAFVAAPPCGSGHAAFQPLFGDRRTRIEESGGRIVVTNVAAQEAHVFKVTCGT